MMALFESAPDSQKSFPQELVDYIIDHFHDDISALRLLALVSKSWLPRASDHIFHTISYERAVKHGRFRSLSLMTKILKTGPSVFLHIRELKMCDIDIALHEFAPILVGLRCLLRLSLDNSIIAGTLPRTSSPTQLSHGIDALYINFCTVQGGISPIVQLIGLFPSMSERSSHRTSKIHLDSLRYTASRLGSSCVAQCVIRLLDDTSPTSLILTPTNQDDHILLTSAASPNMTSFDLDLSRRVLGVANTPTRVDLSSCVVLESITFRFPFSSRLKGEYWEDVSAILTTLPPLSSSVYTLTFCIKVEARMRKQPVVLFDTSNPAWSALEQALRQLPQMRTLRFVWAYYPRKDDLKSVGPESTADFIRSTLHGRQLHRLYQLETVASEIQESADY